MMFQRVINDVKRYLKDRSKLSSYFSQKIPKLKHRNSKKILLLTHL
ncbi:MAG: hypothetical protein N2314_09260 [Brevinematales bacterium]|nr:hypothetical protein [Brevinematales bacterium]